jgi:folate-binding protein YgfZ
MIEKYLAPKKVLGLKNPYQVITLSGLEVIDWMQRVSTVSLRNQDFLPGLFLTGKAGIIGFFLAKKNSPTQVELYVNPEKLTLIQNHIDKMIFGEDVAISVSSKENYEFLIPPDLNLAWDENLKKVESKNFDNAPWSRAFSTEIAITEVEWLEQSEFINLGAFLGFVSDSMNLNEDIMALNLNLEYRIDRNKGCYPGQEVVERLFTAGRKPKALVRLDFVKSKLPEPGEPIFSGDRKVGEVLSIHKLDDCHFAQALILRGDLGKVNEVTLGATQDKGLIREWIES